MVEGGGGGGLGGGGGEKKGIPFSHTRSFSTIRNPSPVYQKGQSENVRKWVLRFIMTTNFTYVIIRVDIFIGPQSSRSGVVFQTICPFWFIFIFLGQSWVAVFRFPATQKIFITVWGLDHKEFYFGLTTLIVPFFIGVTNYTKTQHLHLVQFPVLSSKVNCCYDNNEQHGNNHKQHCLAVLLMQINETRKWESVFSVQNGP